MATLAGVKTLADWAKEIDPDGDTAAIVELLSQTNDILLDMDWREGNLPTGHRTTQRTGLPTVYWKTFNAGVAPSKSTSAQVDEACGILNAWCEIDKDLADLNGNTAAFRMNEARAFVEAMNIEFASTLFYGNASTDPEEFNGLSTRYSSLSANNGQNIINGDGASSDNASVWLLVWGPMTCHGIFPKGSKAGLYHYDYGEQTVETTAGVGSAGARLRVYQDEWKWKCGLALKDWRYASRFCNIDISNLVAKSSAADLIEGMIKQLHVIHNLKMGKPVFYMNRTVFQMLDIQRYDNAAAAGLTYMDVDGHMIPHFRGVPIRICDALLETESAVS